MQLLCRRARGHSELLAEPAAERVVDEERLGSVAARDERLHQEAVPALAVGSAGDQASRGALGRVELAPADLDAGTADELQRTDEDLSEPLPLLRDPGRVLTRQKLSDSDVLRHAGRAPGARVVALGDQALRAVQALGRCFEVDPGSGGKRQLHLAAALQRHDTAELREERAEPVGVWLLVPQHVRELVPGHGLVPPDGQKREREPPLASGQVVLDAPAVDPGDESAAELNPRLPQDFAKVAATWALHNPPTPLDEEDGMGKVINCECGEVIRANDDDELVQKVQQHVGESHPELVGKMSREDVLGMAEEA